MESKSSKKRRKKKEKATEHASQAILGSEEGGRVVGGGEECIAEGGEGKEETASPQVPGNGGRCDNGDTSAQPVSSLNGSTSYKKNPRQASSQEATTSQETTHQTSKCKQDSSPLVASQPLPSKSSFEQELEWCIAQLELGMLRTGASKSQKQQNQKSIQTLQGSKIPLPKKRQLMHRLFGDYRSKMKSQPIPENHTAKEVKLKATKTQERETVGTYYRRCTHHSGKLTQEGGERLEAGFRFNFAV